MPLVEAPGNSFGGFFCDRQSRRVVHDENIVRVRIGGDGHVHVVEMRRVLRPEEQAHVLVRIRFLGGKQVGFQNEIAEDPVRDERDVEWRAGGGIVIALLKEFQRRSAVVRAEPPGFGIGEDKILERRSQVAFLFVKEFVAGGRRGRLIGSRDAQGKR